MPSKTKKLSDRHFDEPADIFNNDCIKDKEFSTSALLISFS